jgi:fused signal recognition particle receptor
MKSGADGLAFSCFHPFLNIMLKNFFKKVTAVVAGRQLDDDLLDELEEQLIMSDVSLDTSSHLIEALRGAAKRGEVPTDGDIVKFLQREISILLGGGVHPLQTNPQGTTVWLFVGVNGVGKTTSVGKLAHRLAQSGHKPLLIAADTFRAAAVEQLQEWGRRANVPVIAQQAGADPAAVVFDGLHAAKSRGCNYVLIDTAGRLHTKSNLMNELAKIARIVERETGAPPDETLLVIDATTGQNGLNQAQTFTQSAPLSGLILTKWDGTAKGGIILSVAKETGVPVKLIGVGEKIEDLQVFDPADFARAMFE